MDEKKRGRPKLRGWSCSYIAKRYGIERASVAEAALHGRIVQLEDGSYDPQSVIDYWENYLGREIRNLSVPVESEIDEEALEIIKREESLSKQLAKFKKENIRLRNELLKIEIKKKNEELLQKEEVLRDFTKALKQLRQLIDDIGEHIYPELLQQTNQDIANWFIDRYERELATAYESLLSWLAETYNIELSEAQENENAKNN